MKKTLTTAILAFTVITSYAQNTKMLGITFGTSTPLGKFAEKGDSSTGYATGGVCYALEYDLITSKNWGFNLSITNQSFGFDAEKYTESNDPDFPLNSYEWTRYNIKSLNFGASYILNKNSKISVIPKIGSSLSVLRNMDIDAEYIDLNTFDNFKVNEFTEANLYSNINFGADFLFRKSPESQFAYCIKLNFQSGNTDLTMTNSYKLNNLYIGKEETKFNRSISSYTFGFGIKYIFKSKA